MYSSHKKKMGAPVLRRSCEIALNTENLQCPQHSVLQIKYLLYLERIEIRDCEKYYEWTETLYRVNGFILVQYTHHFL